MQLLEHHDMCGEHKVGLCVVYVGYLCVYSGDKDRGTEEAFRSTNDFPLMSQLGIFLMFGPPKQKSFSFQDDVDIRHFLALVKSSYYLVHLDDLGLFPYTRFYDFKNPFHFKDMSLHFIRIIKRNVNRFEDRITGVKKSGIAAVSQC